MKDILNFFKSHKQSFTTSSSDDASSKLVIVENEIKNQRKSEKILTKVIPETIKTEVGNYALFRGTIAVVEQFSKI